MFKIKPITSLKVIIKIKVPKDFGKSEPADIEVEFKKLPIPTVRDLLKSIEDSTVTEDEIMKENIIDIKGLKSEEGEDVPYSTDVLEQLMAIEYVRKPLVNGFMKIQLGQEDARRKN